jgi:multidrug efflux system outer membrane protein
VYTSGLGDFLNVLVAQRALYQTEDDEVESQRAVTLNLVALYKALGGGWDTEEKQSNAKR